MVYIFHFYLYDLCGDRIHLMESALNWFRSWFPSICIRSQQHWLSKEPAEFLELRCKESTCQILRALWQFFEAGMECCCFRKSIWRGNPIQNESANSLSMMTLHATGENHMLSIVAQARRGMPAHIPCPSGHQNFCQVVDSLFRPPIRSKWSPSQTNNICSLFGVSQAVVWISAPKMSGKNTHKLNKEQGSYCPTGKRRIAFEISGKGCPTNPRSSSSESENKSSAVKSEKLASTTSSQRPQDHESFKKHGMIRTSWKALLMYQDTLNAS